MIQALLGVEIDGLHLFKGRIGTQSLAEDKMRRGAQSNLVEKRQMHTVYARKPDSLGPENKGVAHSQGNRVCHGAGELQCAVFIADGDADFSGRLVREIGCFQEESPCTGLLAKMCIFQGGSMQLSGSTLQAKGTLVFCF